MRIEKIVCDRCGEEIPKISRAGFFGEKIDEYRIGKLNFGFPFHNVDISRYGIDICERCALDVSAEMYEWKLKIERENEND